jgi:hypothetical protein
MSLGSALLTREVAIPASTWRRFPNIYEISTWVWLEDLRQKYRSPIELGSVPKEEWDEIAAYGFDAVWFMGVWQRSPAGIDVANHNAALLSDFKKALPDFEAKDNVGSPYCVRDYIVDSHLGGPEGLAVARRELSDRGMKLILDFVPNHVAPDHPWVREHPEYFIRGDAEDAKNDAPSFLEMHGAIYACGRDPFFPAWPDVVQLNAFDRGLRNAVITTVREIADQCDGIRCDMAMLMMNTIFERTWGERAGPRPTSEYWPDVIHAVKAKSPNFLFIAEAYWDLEWELQQQGFDFCYDKKLYDRLEHSSAESVRLHLCAETVFAEKLVRFIENHDEPRAATNFSPEKQRAVAITMTTIPGARLFHEGQLEGRKIRPPVFLGRRPPERANEGLRSFYRKLLPILADPLVHKGEWSLCDRSGWPDNASYLNVLAWDWVNGDKRCLIVVNLSDSPAQARVQVRWPMIRSKTWKLIDVLSNVTYERNGDEMFSPGLYLELGPWGYNCFRMT